MNPDQFVGREHMKKKKSSIGSECAPRLRGLVRTRNLVCKLRLRLRLAFCECLAGDSKGTVGVDAKKGGGDKTKGAEGGADGAQSATLEVYLCMHMYMRYIYVEVHICMHM